VNSQFRFACTRCGECCFEQEIWLEPWDLLTLREDRTTRALFAEGVVRIAESDDRFGCLLVNVPMLGTHGCRFVKPRLDEDDTCLGFECSVHDTDKKPFVCRSAPVARRIGAKTFELVAPVQGCPGMNRGPLRLVSEITGIDDARWERSRWLHDASRLLSSAELCLRSFDFDGEQRIADAVALDAYLQRVSGESRASSA
jgi:Fe-S-cluster containining protein